MRSRPTWLCLAGGRCGEFVAGRVDRIVGNKVRLVNVTYGTARWYSIECFPELVASERQWRRKLHAYCGEDV